MITIGIDIGFGIQTILYNPSNRSILFLPRLQPRSIHCNPQYLLNQAKDVYGLELPKAIDALVMVVNSGKKVVKYFLK